MERIEALVGYYTTHDESSRLESRHGSVEFITTVHYIDKYLQKGMKVLDIGAGTGRYAHYFARQGFTVDALDDDLFDFYMKYHLSICERPDMVGATSHILDVFRK